MCAYIYTYILIQEKMPSSKLTATVIHLFTNLTPIYEYQCSK